MAAINPHALYGAVRGTQDYEENLRRQAAFETDQALRQETLKSERELGPMRRRALQLNLDTEERMAPIRVQSAEQKLKLDELTLEERTRLNEELKKASNQKQLADQAYAKFVMTKDPQGLADAIAEIYPEVGLKNAKAVYNDDGTISFSADGVPTETISAGEAPDGSQYSVEDAVGIWMMRMLNPMAVAQARMEQANAMQKENEKTRRAIQVQRIRNEGKSSDEAKLVDKEVKRVRALVNDALRSSIKEGTMIPGYGDPKDAELSNVIVAHAESLVRNGKVGLASEAAKIALNDVSEAYEETKTLADNYAAQLAQAGINPRMEQEVADAAKKGNPSAKALQDLMKTAKKHFGFRVQRHMRNTLKIGSGKGR